MSNPEPMPYQGKFEWDDNYVHDFIYRFWRGENSSLDFPIAVERFKQSKMQKVYPEGIVAFRHMEIGQEFSFKCYISLDPNKNKYQDFCEKGFSFNYKIWSVQNGDEVLVVGDKLYLVQDGDTSIKKFEIGSDGKIWCMAGSGLYVLPDKNIRKQIKKEKTFTTAQMRECFWESRLTNPMVGFKHDTFEDYLKTLHENTKRI